MRRTPIDWLSLATLAAALSLALAGCLDADGEAPPAPRLDLGATARSRLARITLAGAAEYGAALELTRQPPFAAAEAPAEQSADPFTARFSYADVPLVPGDNTFTLAATDAAGNKGAAATLVVTYDDAPLALTLALSAPMMVAGETGPAGELAATAKVLGGLDRFKLDGREVEFELSGVGSETKTGTTDFFGRTTVTFSGLKSVGVGTVVAKVKGAAQVTDAASFVVTAGAPAALTLGLRKAGGSDAATQALSVTAGDEVQAEVGVKDGGQNRVDAPVQLFTDAPGALVSGLTIRRLHAVGTWRVVAAVSGVATAGGVSVSAAGTIEVRAGAPAKLVLSAPAAALAGEAFPWAFSLADAFGNAVTAPAGAAPAITSTDPGLTVEAASQMATLTKAGVQVVTAALPNGPSGSATVTVAPAAPSRLTLALSGVDDNPATPELEVRASLDNVVTAQAAVTDRFQNALALPVTLTSDAPALFDGVSVRGVTKAGTWTVNASLPGTVLFARRTFGVVGLTGASVSLELAAPSTTAGVGVGYAARIVDTFGNVTAEPVALSLDGAAASDYAADDTTKVLTVNKASTAAYVVRARAANLGASITPATASLLVRPGAPAGALVDAGGSTAFSAGATPPFNVVVTDLLGNVIPQPALRLSVVPTGATLAEAPGPVVSAGRIYNLVRPGTYLLVAEVLGTAVVSDTSSPAANISVSAGEAASVDLVLARAVAEVASPLDFRVAVRDAYGNAALGAPVVSVSQGATVVSPAVAGTTWSAPAAGRYTVTASLTLPGRTLVDSEVVTITEATDATGPAIAFQNPAGDPTVPSWPPPGATSPASCAGAGDVAAATATDASLVSALWVGTGGLVASPALSSSAPFPASPIAAAADVCSAAAGSPARGELLVTVAAADLKGNYRTATGSWCVDPDAADYSPANVPYTRCVVARQATAASRAHALAANDSGELVVAREADNGDAFVHLFKRSSAYGLGTGHAITGYASPRGVALAGGVAFSAVTSISRAAIVRTRDLDKAGGGADDPFVSVDTAERFDGVVLGQDGALYATTNPRSAGAFGARLWRFERPLDATVQYAALPATPVASAPQLKLTALCRGPRAGELYGAGYVQASGRTVPTVVRVSLADGQVTTLYTDTEARVVGGCAVTAAGVAVTFSGASGAGAGVVTLLDAAAGALASRPLMDRYSAATAMDRPSGVAVAGGYLFAVSSEGTGSSLVRFARAGGFQP
jgi:hypothetical protein